MSSTSLTRRPALVLHPLLLFRRVDRRWWLALLVVVALAVAAWWKFAPDSSSSGAQRITTTVSRGTFKSTVSATGTITPKRSEDLAFTSSGTVTAVAVEAGDKVEKGDVLARIDSTTLQAQRDAARSQLSAARTQLSEDSDASSSQIAADEASVASAESQLAQAQDALDNATLTAPFSGTVSAVSYSVGDLVGSSGAGSTTPTAAASSSSSSGITVISPRKLVVDAEVPAADVSQLKAGMQAEITPTGGGNVVYGTVADIGSIASASSSGAAQFPVTIEVTGRPTGLYAGASASVAITVKQATDVLAVPTRALHASGDTTYVYVIKNGARVETPVTIGSTYGAQTEVTSGLDDGDTVEVISFTAPRTTGNNGGGGGLFQRNGNDNGLPGGGNFPGGGAGGFPGGAPPNLGSGQ